MDAWSWCRCLKHDLSILVCFGMPRGAKLIAPVPTRHTLFFGQCAQNSKDLPISVRMHQMKQVIRRTWESSGESTTFSMQVCMIAYIDALIRSKCIHTSFNLPTSGLLVYAATDYVHSGWSCYTIGYISSLTWNTCYFGWNMTCVICKVAKTYWILRRKLPLALKVLKKTSLLVWNMSEYVLGVLVVLLWWNLCWGLIH